MNTNSYVIYRVVPNVVRVTFTRFQGDDIIQHQITQKMVQDRAIVTMADE